MKRQSKQKEKMPAKHVSDKGLVSRIHKERLQLTNLKKKIPKHTISERGNKICENLKKYYVRTWKYRNKSTINKQRDA